MKPTGAKRRMTTTRPQGARPYMEPPSDAEMEVIAGDITDVFAILIQHLPIWQRAYRTGVLPDRPDRTDPALD